DRKIRGCFAPQRGRTAPFRGPVRSPRGTVRSPRGRSQNRRNLQPTGHVVSGVKEALADAQASRVAAPLRRLLARGPAGADPLSLHLPRVAAVPAAGNPPRGGLLLPEGAAVPAGPPARRPESGLRGPLEVPSHRRDAPWGVSGLGVDVYKEGV